MHAPQSTSLTCLVAFLFSAESVAVAPATTVDELMASSGGEVKVPAGDGGLAHPGFCWLQTRLWKQTQPTEMEVSRHGNRHNQQRWRFQDMETNTKDREGRSQNMEANTKDIEGGVKT